MEQNTTDHHLRQGHVNKERLPIGLEFFKIQRCLVGVREASPTDRNQNLFKENIQGVNCTGLDPSKG
jgi:hypothetical protein